MKLDKSEQLYFEALVGFGNAKTTDEKEFNFRKLQEFCKNHRAKELRQNQFEYFSHWYNSVIRELVTIIPWNGNYSILAKAVQPAIKISQAKDSVLLLEQLRLITKIDDGVVTGSQSV